MVPIVYGVFQGHVWERDRKDITKEEEIHEPESSQSVKEREVKWWGETTANGVVRYWSSATAPESRCWYSDCWKTKASVPGMK